MTEIEKAQQLIIAKAMLRRAQRSLSDKVGTQEQVDEAQKRIDELVGFDVPKFQKQVEKEERAALRSSEAGRGAWVNAPEQVGEYPQEVKDLIDNLIKQRDEVHFKKSELCNSLHKISKDKSAKAEVLGILNFRNEWKALNAKIRFVQQYRQLPPEENEAPDLSKNLTIDEGGFRKSQDIKELWVLKQDIENKRTVLSKARKNLSKVKELSKQAHYKQKIAELEWELRLMTAVFEARK